MEQRKLEGTGEQKALAQVEGEVSPSIIKIENLVVSQLPRQDIALGDARSLVQVFDKLKHRVEGIIWNEDRIEFITSDRSTRIMFAPELTPEAQLFFQRKRPHVNRYEDEDCSQMDRLTHFYEGDYEPVAFSKRRLLKFLKEHVTLFPKEIQEAIKNLKVSQIATVSEQLMDEDSDNLRSVSENQVITNLPNTFTMTLPITEGQTAEIDLEATPCKTENRGGMGIELQCTNARQVMRELMQHVLAQLPPEIPRYYGARRLSGGKE